MYKIKRCIIKEKNTHCPALFLSPIQLLSSLTTSMLDPRVEEGCDGYCCYHPSHLG